MGDAKTASKCMERESVDKYGSYLEVGLDRNGYSLRSVIEVKPSYPKPPPVIVIFLGKKGVDDGCFINDNVSMSSTINAKFAYVDDGNRKMVLSMMLYRLQTCFDLFVDVNEGKPKLSMADAPSRTHRGRDRRHP